MVVDQFSSLVYIGSGSVFEAGGIGGSGAVFELGGSGSVFELGAHW